MYYNITKDNQFILFSTAVSFEVSHGQVKLVNTPVRVYLCTLKVEKALTIGKNSRKIVNSRQVKLAALLFTLIDFSSSENGPNVPPRPKTNNRLYS